MRLAHYWHKMQHVGASRFYAAIHARIKKKCFIYAMRSQAYKGRAHTTWQSAFESFFQLRQHDIEPTIDHATTIKLADCYAKNCFDLLGSGEYCFATVAWHSDFRLRSQDPQADCDFDTDIFYADISISSAKTPLIQKDIKVPWELSRFQYTPVLAYAYHITGDAAYAHAAKKQIHSWLDHNPYLLGINWMNPMEVAIRATNWITAWRWLQPFFIKDRTFCKRFICSLYDHMQFIEHNWEWYDGRSSNHYLSNLVGYAYLNWFFNDTKRWHYCFEQLKSELEWQVFDEGTSYEGSTRYHRLVTELFLHGFIIAKQMGETIEKKIVHKIERMVQFITHCSPIDQEPIAIGDDDSGSFMHKGLYGLDQLLKKLGGKENTDRFGIFHFRHFGLSIIKQSDWHITLRHHVYHPRQPSGHFHEDAGSITLSYKGILILVDPGSYLYTASSYWRNKFRSKNMHNTVFSKDTPHDNLNDLFALPLSFSNNYLNHVNNAVDTTYTCFGGRIHRSISIKKNSVLIYDKVETPSEWHFIFGPDIILLKENTHWVIRYQNKPLLYLETQEIVFTKAPSFYSSIYGKNQQVDSLRGSSCHFSGIRLVESG